MNELICKTCCRCKGDVKICKLKADCIVCEREILEHCQDLKKINSNGSNCYYHVDGTNTVIVHIEEGLCILCDNNIAGLKAVSYSALIFFIVSGLPPLSGWFACASFLYFFFRSSIVLQSLKYVMFVIPFRFWFLFRWGFAPS